MKIKKYIAPTMPEVMKKIRNDLGKDAVILNSKEIRTGGFLGFFTKPSLEVVAALDPDPVYASEKKEDISSFKRVAEHPIKQSKGSSTPERMDKDEMQQLLRQLANQKSDTGHLPPEIRKLDLLLENQGVNNELRGIVSKGLLKKWYQGESEQYEVSTLIIWMKEILLDILPENEFGGFKYDKQFLNLIGPTGVGKTTTIAKIAADAVLNKKKKAALITTDTYRIAAIEQLKTYAEILDLPLEVAYNQEDFQKAKKKFEDFDVILVDSAGRNFKNSKYVTDLEQIYQFDEGMENYLVLSLTSKYTDMLKITNQFQDVPISKLVFTKKDETDTYGDMFNIMHETKLGAAYITVGQNVPDDIKEASRDQVIGLLIGDGPYA